MSFISEDGLGEEIAAMLSISVIYTLFTAEMLHTRIVVHGAIPVARFYCQIGTRVPGENAEKT